jgi:hypothetical protein
MKELGDFLDPNLDRIRGSRRMCRYLYSLHASSGK